MPFPKASYAGYRETLPARPRRNSMARPAGRPRRIPNTASRSQSAASFSRPARDIGEFLLHAPERPVPIADRSLTKNTHARIPWAVGPIEQPPPIRREWHQKRYRLAHGAGEMHDRCVDADHEIEHRHDGGGVGKVGKIATEIEHAMLAQDCGIRFADLFLHADEVEAGNGEQRCEAGKRYRAITVVGVERAARPADPDAQAAVRRHPLLP